jgi:hypothetical protein
MAIPKEKNRAVQLVVTIAFCVAAFALFQAAWYGITGEHGSPWVSGVVSIVAGAVFFWWYGYMQGKQKE